MPHFVQPTHPASPGYFTFRTHSPPGPQPFPAFKANKNLCFPPLLCITLCPSRDPKATHSVGQVTIGNCSLTTACRTPVYWPQRAVSSHPSFAMLLLTVSSKTVMKNLFKIKTTDNHFFFPTNKACCCVSGVKEIGFRRFTPDKYMSAVLLTSFHSRVL